MHHETLTLWLETQIKASRLPMQQVFNVMYNADVLRGVSITKANEDAITFIETKFQTSGFKPGTYGLGNLQEFLEQEPDFTETNTAKDEMSYWFDSERVATVRGYFLRNDEDGFALMTQCSHWAEEHGYWRGCEERTLRVDPAILRGSRDGAENYKAQSLHRVGKQVFWQGETIDFLTGQIVFNEMPYAYISNVRYFENDSESWMEHPVPSMKVLRTKLYNCASLVPGWKDTNNEN